MACGFAAYIAYDTQTIVGGKHKKRSLNTKEYILASLVRIYTCMRVHYIKKVLLNIIHPPPLYCICIGFISRRHGLLHQDVANIGVHGAGGQGEEAKKVKQIIELS